MGRRIGRIIVVVVFLLLVFGFYPIDRIVLAGGKMYWVDSGKIQRANLDGTTVEDLVTGLSAPIGIALDVAGGKMYWTNVAPARKIQRANLNGSSVEDLVTFSLVIAPRGIALDVAAGKMYWTDSEPEKIQRANLNGSSVEDLVTTAFLSFPRGIALDVAAGKMYWADRVSNKIQRANLNGTTVEDLVTGLSAPIGIALDVAAGKMYWTQSGAGKITRANLNGSSVEDLVTGLGWPYGIALDVAGGKMYWVDNALGKIQRANLDGTTVEDLVTGLGGPFDIALVDGTDLVAIDIKPQSCPNPLNVKSKGVLPVAILGTVDLDVGNIDIATLELDGVAPVKSAFEDVATPTGFEPCSCLALGGDGSEDLVLKFNTQEIVANLPPVQNGDEIPLTLTGALLDGTAIEGIDCVVIKGAE